MHRYRRQTAAGVALVFMFVAGIAVSAQKNPYRNYTEEKFVQNMQSADRNYSAVTALIAKNDYESAKAQLTRAREQMAITVTFWRDAKRDDAVAMLRKALLGMDDLDIALGAEKVDPSAIAGASEHIGAACQPCHAAYREQDPSTKAYRVRRLAQ
jgi:cytochrome c556